MPSAVVSTRPCKDTDHEWLEDLARRQVVCRYCGLRLDEHTLKAHRKQAVRWAERDWYIDNVELA